jgi:hypothetical protein
LQKNALMRGRGFPCWRSLFVEMCFSSKGKYLSAVSFSFCRTRTVLFSVADMFCSQVGKLTVPLFTVPLRFGTERHTKRHDSEDELEKPPMPAVRRMTFLTTNEPLTSDSKRKVASRSTKRLKKILGTIVSYYFKASPEASASLRIVGTAEMFQDP